jgi:hypothetical protein
MVALKVSPRLACAAAALLIGAAGCSTGHKPPAAPTPSNTALSAPSMAAPAITPAASVAPGPAGGPVPGGFAAASVTFVSVGEAFVLGTAPCAAPPCTSVLRTLDRGASWRGLPAPPVRIGRPGLAGAPAVWGIRFATPARGFVFGDGLWETADGGAHWTRDTQPGDSILALAVLDGQVLALTGRSTLKWI